MLFRMLWYQLTQAQSIIGDTIAADTTGRRGKQEKYRKREKRKKRDKPTKRDFNYACDTKDHTHLK